MTEVLSHVSSETQLLWLIPKATPLLQRQPCLGENFYACLSPLFSIPWGGVQGCCPEWQPRGRWRGTEAEGNSQHLCLSHLQSQGVSAALPVAQAVPRTCCSKFTIYSLLISCKFPDGDANINWPCTLTPKIKVFLVCWFFHTCTIANFSSIFRDCFKWGLWWILSLVLAHSHSKQKGSKGWPQPDSWVHHIIARVCRAGHGAVWGDVPSLPVYCPKDAVAPQRGGKAYREKLWEWGEEAHGARIGAGERVTREGCDLGYDRGRTGFGEGVRDPGRETGGWSVGVGHYGWECLVGWWWFE